MLALEIDVHKPWPRAPRVSQDVLLVKKVIFALFNWSVMMGSYQPTGESHTTR
jgi:hypothetical protein